MRLTRRRSALLLVALLLVAAVTVAGCSGGAGGTAGAGGLKYNFKAGDSITYDLKVVMNGTVNAPGVSADESTLPKDSTLDARFSISVKDVQDGIASITYKYEKMTMTADGKTEDMPVDSIPEVTVKVDQYGKIQSMEGADSGILGSLFGSSGSSLPIDPSQLGGSSIVPLPKDGAKVGDEWTETVEQTIPGLNQKVQATTTAKLVALDKVDGNDVATVDFTTKIPMDLSIDLGSMLSAMGQATGESTELKFVMGMKGDESFSGTTKVNLSKGLPSEFSGKATVKLAISIIEAPEEMIPADQRGPFDIDMTMDITLNQVK